MDVAVVGAGKVGTAFAVLLRRAGHRIVAVSGGEGTAARGASFLPGVEVLDPAAAASLGEVVVIATPDDRIAPVAAELARRHAFAPGRAVLHLSGATGLDALAPAAATGATTLSLHPLQTFPSVEAAIERIPGAAMAVTAAGDDGWSLGERLATDAGARPFRLADEARPLYHAAAVFASNYVVAVAALAERLFEAAGVDQPLPLFAPLARTSLEGALAAGPAEALTGPAARGDAGTVERNLEALSLSAPEAVPAYVALAAVALDLAERSGRLDPDVRAGVEEVLARWR